MNIKKAVEENRLGKFFIPAPYFKEKPELVRSIQSQCLIVESKYEEVYDAYNILAYSPHFDPIRSEVGKDYAPTYFLEAKSNRFGRFFKPKADVSEVDHIE